MNRYIAQRNARKKYEFGKEVSVAVPSKSGWLLGAMCVSGNPYDNNTLQLKIQQIDPFYSKKPTEQTVHVDMGYRGHDCAGDQTVIVDKRWRGETSN